MYVHAPRLQSNGILSKSTIAYANIAPSGSGHASAGFGTKAEAIAAAMSQNTNFPGTPTTYSERSWMQSGILDFKRYKNTNYRCSYERREILNRSIVLCRHYASKRWFAESVPIRLGTADSLYTGWLDKTGQTCNPWGTLMTFEAIYNRTVVSNTQRRGIVECKQKMLESKMDLAESLVDIDKSVRMICDRAMRILGAWKHVRKGEFHKALPLLGITKRNLNFKSASEAWLEMQYGWLPLLNDVFSGVEVVKDLLGDPLQHHTYAKRRVKGDLWVPSLSGQSGEWLFQQNQKIGYCEVETKYRFRIENAVLAYITGFQLSNPLYVTWISVPFTFVVDWFLPIGDWLGSLTATHGLQFVDGYQTTKTFASVTVSGHRRTTWRHIWIEKEPVQRAQSRVESVTMQRTAFTSWPMSYTYFKFPFTSPQRVASAIALTHLTARLR